MPRWDSPDRPLAFQLRRAMLWAVVLGTLVLCVRGIIQDVRHAVRMRADVAVIRGAFWLVAAIALQATLGVLTLLNQVPIDLALTHQAVAIAVLTFAIFQAERLAERQPQAAPRKLVVPVGQPG